MLSYERRKKMPGRCKVENLREKKERQKLSKKTDKEKEVVERKVRDREAHRVDRVAPFLSSRPNWLSPPPSPESES
jgi:hypothetical protein